MAKAFGEAKKENGEAGEAEGEAKLGGGADAFGRGADAVVADDAQDVFQAFTPGGGGGKRGEDQMVAGVLDHPRVENHVVGGETIARGHLATEGIHAHEVEEALLAIVADGRAGVDVVEVEALMEQTHALHVLEELQAAARIIWP